MGIVKCPACQNDFGVSLVEAISESETFEVSIGSETSELIRAELVGETMQAFAKMLRETGRCLGGSFEVYVLSVDVQPKKVTIKFAGSHAGESATQRKDGDE